jgi:hypothetical protein
VPSDAPTRENKANPGRRSLLVAESTPPTTRPLDALPTATEALGDPGASLLRGPRMRHHPRSSIIGVAEVRHGPLAVDGEVAPFRAELERWLTT